MSKVEKTVVRSIDARSTRDEHFDIYKKHLRAVLALRGVTGIEKVDGRSCVRVFSL